jgi:hypothetical protein
MTLSQHNEGIVITIINFVQVKPYTINVVNFVKPSFKYISRLALVH